MFKKLFKRNETVKLLKAKAKIEKDLKGKEAIIKTYSGTLVNLMEPETMPIDIRDIAHALSMTCRYGGHAQKFYSVAEHCVLLARLAKYDHQPLILQKCLLMHDAAEAYVGDIVNPLKQHLPHYKVIEDRILKQIFIRYNLQKDWDQLPNLRLKVHTYDKEMYFREAPFVFDATKRRGRYDVAEPYFWSQEKAKHEFISTFNNLWKKNDK